MKRIALAVVVAILAASATYFASEQQDVPVTGRSQRVALSDDEQQQLGLQVFEQTLEEQGPKVITSGKQYEMVTRVAERITKVAAADKPDFEWEVALVDDPQVNAFCLPGGKIVIYTGILPIARDDDGLATVMGHEVAHAVAEHGAERIFRQRLTDAAIAGAAGTLAEDPQKFRQLAGLMGAGAQVGLQLPWGRAQESEGDHIGLIYMARAGYDPAASMAFWTRMAKASKGAEPPEYLSTHPSHGTRVRQLREWLPEAQRERP